MAEQIQIVISERGSRTVKRNIDDIGTSSKRTDSFVGLLKKSLLGFSVGASFLTAARQVGQFQDAMAETSTLVDTASFDMQQLTKDALANASAFGKFPREQAQAQYQIISAGATSAAQAQDILTSSNKLAVGGVTDLTVAADGLTSVLNAYGDQVESAEAVSDALFVGVKAGKTTIDELSSSIGKVAPLAATLNVEFDELVASIAALTKGGINTREAVTGIRAILAAVAKPTSEAAKAANQLGIEFSAAGLQSKGFAGFLEEVVEKTQGSPEALAQLFGGVEALVPVMALAGQAGEDFYVILEEMAEKGGATQEAFDKMAASPGFQSARLFAALSAAAIRLGDGISRAVLPAIRFLADNMDSLVISVQAAIAGFVAYRTALFLTSGPLGVFLGLVVSTTRAFGVLAGAQVAAAGTGAILTSVMRSLNVALLANPIGLVVGAITLAVVAFNLFADEIKVTSDGVVSLKDVFVAAFELIGESLAFVTAFFQEGWKVATEAVNGLFEVFGTTASAVLSTIGEFAKTMVNSYIGFWVVAYNTISTVWNNFPGFMDVIFTNVINIAASAAEVVLNAWQAPLQAIAAGLDLVSEGGGAGLRGVLDSISVELPRAKVNAAGKAFNKDLADGFAAGGADFLGNAATAVLDRARKNSVDNAIQEAAKANAANDNVVTGGGDGVLGGGGASGTDAGGKAAANLRTREGLLKRINDETDNSIGLAKSLNFEWEKVDEDIIGINERLARQFGENAVLNEQETDTLREKLKTMYDLEEAQDAMRQAYNRFAGPQRDYEIGQKAINRVMQEFPEFAQEGVDALRRLRIEYLRTKTDLASGLEAGRLEVQDDVSTGNAARATQAYKREWQGANQAILDAQATQAALQQLMKDDPVNSGHYATELRNVKFELDEIKLSMGDASFGDAMRIGLQRFVSDFRGVIPGLKVAWSNFFTSFADGFANSVGRAIVYSENLGDALKSVAQSALQELIAAVVKLGIQWVVMQLLGSAAATGAAATSAAAGSTVAAAWAPAAAAVSLASFGTNAVPAAIGIASTYALTTALSKIGGFKDGGFIQGPGGPRSDSILARLSNGEFVVNAEATRQFLPMLEAMNANKVPAFAAGGKVSKASVSGSRLASLATPANNNSASSGGDTYNFAIDARGAEAGVEEKIGEALDQAMPEFLKKARKQTAADRAEENRRQRIGGGR